VRLQAIGRCIRHRHDYGAIILADERFRAPVRALLRAASVFARSASDFTGTLATD
jgi:Rad3-related DNA helicase